MTDGITEVQDSQGRYYGETGRLTEVSLRMLNQSAEAIVEAIVADAIAFGGEKAQRDDDMAVLVVKMV
jgi:serine phosphatase RsbU (regulator of sigma subunit)